MIGASKPPRAEKKTHRTTIHGITLTDDYFWLRQRSNKDAVRHVEAENRYAEAAMRPTRALQKKLYREFVSRIQETDMSVSGSLAMIKAAGEK